MTKMINQNLYSGPQDLLSSCRFCGNSEEDCIYDYTSGDVICRECGSVISDKGLAMSDHMIYKEKRSKPYARAVHLQQRLAKLTGIDPELPEEAVDAIGRELGSREYGKFIPSKYGRKTFREVCHKLGLPTKYSESWIQLRRRLNYLPPPPEIHPTLLKRIKMRYFCVDKAFEAMLKVRSRFHKVNPLQRTNIVNMNYSIAQMIRMEDEYLFRSVARFFPQLCADHQPDSNNERWRILVKYCKKHYGEVSDPATGETTQFEWNYIPMTEMEILLYFTHFF